MSRERIEALSLFAGIGGIDVGLEAVNVGTAAYSELEPYPCAVLAERYPDALALGDVTKADWSLVAGLVQMIVGGFPCQDISLAGRGEGLDGERSGLWREYRAAIDAIRPAGVLIENVAALTSRGLDRVLADLCVLGYDAEWDTIGAAALGAPHLRERIFVIAWPTGSCEPGGWPEPPMWDGWRREPDGVPRVLPSAPNRVGRLRGLGNAVAPPVAAYVAGILRERMAGDPGRPERGGAHEFATWSGERWEGRQLDLFGDAQEADEFPRAGRLLGNVVFERERVAPQAWAKGRALESIAPTLIGERGHDDPAPGLLPTPTTQDAANNGGPSQFERNSLPLNAAVTLLPTPTASSGGASDHREGGPNLHAAVRHLTADGLLTTPCASETGARGTRYAQGGTPLAMQAGGALNPEWVEWVMGFPLGWSNVSGDV